MIPTWETFDPFFQDFASEVLIGSLGGEVAIRGIFDNQHYEAEGEYSSISIRQSMLTCKSSDVDSLATGTRVVVAGVTYKVVDIRPDGTGITELALHLA